MGRISLLGTGNIAFSGNEIYSTNDNSLLFGNDLIPTTISTFNIGSSANPFKTLFISASTLQMAAPSGGNSLAILNDGSNFQISNGGLRSTVIYTGGLLLSGNNIGADPAVGALPMNIGTNGLPAVNFLAPLSAQANTYLNNLSANNGTINKIFSNFKIVSTVTNTTAVDVDFSKDTLIHLHAYKNGTINSVTNPLILNPINFTAGSIIDVLIFNPLPSNGVVYINWGGVNSSFPNYLNTSGAPYILALSSVSLTQTCHFKYICTDGTLTNTFFTN